MIALLARVFRWVSKNLAYLIVIVLVMYCWKLLKPALREFKSGGMTISILQSSLTELERFANEAAPEVKQRLQDLPKVSSADIDSRLKDIETKIAARKAIPRACHNLLVCALNGSRKEIVSDYKSDVELRLLEFERNGLSQVAGKRTLERLRREHASVNQKLKDEFPREARPCYVNPRAFQAWIHAKLSASERLKSALCQKSKEASTAYARQMERDTEFGKLLSARDVALNAIAPVKAKLRVVTADATRTWVGKVLHELAPLLPRAFGFLAGALVALPAIKSFLYYVLAPVASGRPPIQLLPNPAYGTAGSASGPGSDSGTKFRSSVSRAVKVDADHELLVHSDYLQSSATGAGKDTKWLLHAGYPLTSLAAGMVVLTRIRPTSSESVVVSSTTDPLSEVGVLALDEGDALVLQPHYLVGILQLRAQPLRITSHWRLGSLSAWLTLQLRYLVFHGPGSLVVKGSRGICVESADSGRLINQAATMGFSAGLLYSTVRSETFVPYLQGTQGLFKDRFAGSPGFYVYEEMPYAGKRSGITGRGLEVLMDSVRSVFGI